MGNITITQPIASGEDANQDAELDYAKAQKLAAAQTRRELATKVKELRRQADAAKERARKAQQRFEKTVTLLASDKPERPDWYEHPGALPRKALLEAASLNTVQLHRIMERGRTTKPKRTPARRAR